MTIIYRAAILLIALLLRHSHCLPSFFTLSSYAPSVALCPSTPLIRSAEGLSQGEVYYQFGRRRVSSAAFASFFDNLNNRLSPGDAFQYNNTPIVALASSGGRLRALLSGAGFVQALDARESSNESSSLTGLYQSLSYHVGLDGGAWLVSALASNNNHTVSQLYSSIWESSFRSADFLPAEIKKSQAYARIALDLAAKEMNGFQSTLVDAWGGLLSYHLLNNTAGSVNTMSGLLSTQMFSKFQAPYPIITALGSSLYMDQRGCDSIGPQSLQYEFHPFETGTWEPGFRVFAQTPFLGTPLINGTTLAEGLCLRKFDHLASILATSSNSFFNFCSRVPGTNLLTGDWGDLQNDVIGLTGALHTPTFRDEYGVFPNPFFQSGLAPALAADENLYLVNGAGGGENVPLWPLIQPERHVDVILVNDNSDDTRDGYPDGISLYNSWVRSQQAGLDTMPPIPLPATLNLSGRAQRPTFFGCHNSSTITIIYVPNSPHILESNISSFALRYTQSEIRKVIANGNMVATQGNDPNWPYCLACGLMLRANQGVLPDRCSVCFEQYCWPKWNSATNFTTLSTKRK